MPAIEPTSAQLNAIDSLRREYGQGRLEFEHYRFEDHNHREIFPVARGLVRLVYPNDHLGLGQRTFIIRPDGSRLTWTAG